MPPTQKCTAMQDCTYCSFTVCGSSPLWNLLVSSSYNFKEPLNDTCELTLHLVCLLYGAIMVYTKLAPIQPHTAQAEHLVKQIEQFTHRGRALTWNRSGSHSNIDSIPDTLHCYTATAKVSLPHPETSLPVCPIHNVTVLQSIVTVQENIA